VQAFPASANLDANHYCPLSPGARES
jgi:hypothetical protein